MHQLSFITCFRKIPHAACFGVFIICARLARFPPSEYDYQYIFFSVWLIFSFYFFRISFRLREEHARFSTLLDKAYAAPGELWKKLSHLVIMLALRFIHFLASPHLRVIYRFSAFLYYCFSDLRWHARFWCRFLSAIPTGQLWQSLCQLCHIRLSYQEIHCFYYYIFVSLSRICSFVMPLYISDF